MMSAPRVNQIRLLSSDALAKAPKLMLAASCSAADAILIHPTQRPPATAQQRRYGEAAATAPFRPPFVPLTRTITLPPAFSTAAIAFLEAPATSIVIGI